MTLPSKVQIFQPLPSCRSVGDWLFSPWSPFSVYRIPFERSISENTRDKPQLKMLHIVILVASQYATYQQKRSHPFEQVAC